MYDIIIVGAGPAGMTAAIYALRANKKVLIFEAKSYGGQIVNANKVENHPGFESISGFDLATNMYNQVKNLGGEFKFESVKYIDDNNKVITSNGEYEAKAIILAIGAENRKLNVDGEANLIGKGVSYCATCDGNFYKGKVVAVVGGGNTALEDAIYLSGIANKVYVIHRNDTFRAEESYQNELKEKNNIECIMNANVTKINGTDRIESIDLYNGKNITIDGLFIAVGQVPNNAVFSNVVSLNDKGYIVSDDGVHTNREHVYVAGDAREKNLRQLVTAESDGAIAATIAIKEMER
nr:FAD-dependent oxidoreductase [Bacilli bacterium]